MNLHNFLMRMGSSWLGVRLSALLILSPIAFVNTRGLTPERTRLGYASDRLLKPLATIVVNTTGDGDNVDANTGCDADAATPGEQCTLRAAIQRANALAGDDAITFNIPATQPSCDAGTGVCTVNLTKALPNLSTNIEINGPGANKLTVRRDTGGDYRIFRVTSFSTVTFSGLTISKGRVVGNEFGGGIESFGTVNINNCTVTGNSTSLLGGGGISNSGTMNVTGSTITSNIAVGLGGGIVNSGTLTVINSKISGNSADQGGGILNAQITNVTGSVISGNTATGGGGITNTRFTVNVTNSLVSNNSANGTNSTTGGGAGIRNAGGTINVINSVVYVAVLFFGVPEMKGVAR